MNERTTLQPQTTLSSGFTPARTGLLQRRCACGGTPGPSGECAECRRRRQALQSRSANQPAASLSSLFEHNVLLSPSEQPESTVHDFRGSRLGHDFGQINVYPERGLRTRTARDTVSLFETDEGTETLNPGHRDTKTADGGSPDGAAPTATGCSVTGSFSSIPSGSVAATLTGSKLGASFRMVGDFTPSIPCNCSCGEYRQYVRGSFTRNGSSVTHALCGTNLDPKTYQEDCGIFGGKTYKYGYRSIPFATSKFTTPDQATGCRFEGSDAPGITGSSGDKLAVSLDFRGELVDACNGNKVLATSSWNVSGAATVP